MYITRKGKGDQVGQVFHFPLLENVMSHLPVDFVSSSLIRIMRYCCDLPFLFHCESSHCGVENPLSCSNLPRIQGTTRLRTRNKVNSTLSTHLYGAIITISSHVPECRVSVTCPGQWGRKLAPYTTLPLLLQVVILSTSRTGPGHFRNRLHCHQVARQVLSQWRQEISI